jgi:hypothetical protein
VSEPTPVCGGAARTDGHARRRPEETLLHELVGEHRPRFEERAEERGGGLPQFVVREFEQYLPCGILEHGLARPRACTAWVRGAIGAAPGAAPLDRGIASGSAARQR